MNERFTYKNTQSGSASKTLTTLRNHYGFTGVFNTHMMVILTSNLRPLERNVLLYAIHQTIGWNKLETLFDTTDWASVLDSSKGGIETALKTLEEKGCLSRSNKRNHNKSSGILRIEPNHLMWSGVEYDRGLVDKVQEDKNEADNKSNKKELTEQELDNLLRGL